MGPSRELMGSCVLCWMNLGTHTASYSCSLRSPQGLCWWVSASGQAAGEERCLYKQELPSSLSFMRPNATPRLCNTATNTLGEHISLVWFPPVLLRFSWDLALLVPGLLSDLLAVSKVVSFKNKRHNNVPRVGSCTQSMPSPGYHSDLIEAKKRSCHSTEYIPYRRTVVLQVLTDFIILIQRKLTDFRVKLPLLELQYSAHCNAFHKHLIAKMVHRSSRLGLIVLKTLKFPVCVSGLQLHGSVNCCCSFPLWNRKEKYKFATLQICFA